MTKYNWVAGLGVVVALACGSESGAPSVSTDPVTADDAVSDSGSPSDAGGIRNPVVPTIPGAPVPVDAGLPPPPTIVDAGTPLPPPALADAGEPPPPASEPDAGAPDAGPTACHTEADLQEYEANCLGLDNGATTWTAYCACKRDFYSKWANCSDVMGENDASKVACPRPVPPPDPVDAGGARLCGDASYLGDLIANCADLEFHIELEPRKAWCKCKAYYWADRKTCDQMQHDPVTEDELAAMNAACPKPAETIP